MKGKGVHVKIPGIGKTKGTVDATIRGRNPNGNTGDMKREGETPGAGTLHSGVLNQRPNSSNIRNMGPEGMSSEIGNQEMPVVMKGDRKTGKIA